MIEFKIIRNCCIMWNKIIFCEVDELEYIVCCSCINYCNEEEVSISDVSSREVCPNCGMFCPNCNALISEKDYLKATNKCIGCDDFY